MLTSVDDLGSLVLQRDEYVFSTTIRGTHTQSATIISQEIGLSIYDTAVMKCRNHDVGVFLFRADVFTLALVCAPD